MRIVSVVCATRALIPRDLSGASARFALSIPSSTRHSNAIREPNYCTFYAICEQCAYLLVRLYVYVYYIYYTRAYLCVFYYCIRVCVCLFIIMLHRASDFLGTTASKKLHTVQFVSTYVERERRIFSK